MRVVSGSARGKKLLCAEGIDIRPTLDRIKESVFNIIAFDIPDACVLDLFSGSGALGIEALSRGAKECTFVDIAVQSVSVTKKNLDATHLAELASVHCGDSIEFLNNTHKKYDVIFIDPPYNSELYQKALDVIFKNKILTDDGFIVVEYDTEITPDFKITDFKVIKEKKYGRVKILLLGE